ncbi:UDP-glucose 6-dehydrogenase ywqF [Nocardia otitidiscaviarum]|uniref:UDP-glucose 6-dehydrogenase ywqF n=1 Tax=Nocardia otitidiscaviarum TaxID=1823 RepID=A0A379JJW1_9NOCA|nr:nucleotide sugar dehydrogenase [Nocardia otitidiscaviarum]SUD48857.1 UDP-glucose 6-dehydrogenase ywqF [Nocardia otitidiscaviarum]
MNPATTRAKAAGPRKVVVIGQGFVGLPAAMLAQQTGHMVIGFDTDLDRITRLRSGDSYISDVPSHLLRQAQESGRYWPTHDTDALDNFDVALVAVPTPVIGDHPDLSYVQAAAKTLAPHLRPGCLVALESTSYPGTTETVFAPILETAGLIAGRDFHLGYAPERLNPGSGITSIARIPKIVAGIDRESLHAVTEFWQGLIDTVIPAPDIRTAEVAKLIENTFRLLNISFVNELAQQARHLGVDIWSALNLAATKPYGYMEFRPSVGAGGHCLPSDTAYLSWRLREVGRSSQLIATALRINTAQPGYVANRILTACAPIDGQPRIVVVGATYKPDVADIRDSAALKVTDILRSRGADVTIVDPLLGHHPGILTDLTPDTVAHTDLVALLVAHRGLDYPLIRTAPRVFDACAALTPAAHIERL